MTPTQNVHLMIRNLCTNVTGMDIDVFPANNDTVSANIYKGGIFLGCQYGKAAMYIWAKIPEAYANLGSLEFSKKLLTEAKLAAAPGIGFGEYGDDHVRLALIENEERIRQAVRGIKDMFRKDGLISSSEKRNPV